MERIDANTRAQGETTEEVRGLRRDMQGVMRHFAEEPTLPGRVLALEEWRRLQTEAQKAAAEAQRDRDRDARQLRNRVYGSLIVVAVLAILGAAGAGVAFARERVTHSEVAR